MVPVAGCRILFVIYDFCHDSLCFGAGFYGQTSKVHIREIVVSTDADVAVIGGDFSDPRIDVCEVGGDVVRFAVSQVILEIIVPIADQQDVRWCGGRQLSYA